MQDHELKKILQDLDVPPPSDGAKERAVNLAKQAFIENQQKNAKTRKGSETSARPISTTNTWDNLIRSFTMKKAYALTGSFAAVAVVLLITTTHYSTIMQPVTGDLKTKPQDEKPLTQEQPKKEVVELEKQLDATASVEAKKKDEAQPQEQIASGVVNNAAPGMGRESNIVAAAPAPVAAMQAQGLPQAESYVASPPPPPAPGMAGNVAKSAHRAASVDMAAGASAPGMQERVASSIMPYPTPVPPPYYSGGDKFESFVANETKSVAQEPVSTFSIDVDTASYSFVRRMLNQNQLPSPDMVRTEEMINYFDYNYPMPTSKAEPFKPTVTVVPNPWNNATKLVHIGIKGFDNAGHPPANLVFLIDVSGSMSSQDKLPLVKSSLKMLVDQMKPDDTIGIVTYAGYAGTALSPTKISDKQKIISVIDQLGAGGGTAGGEGIREAYRLAESSMRKDGVNRVILATDGDFNVGITDPAQLTKFIEEKRETGVTLSILGFGQGNYNDALMQKLAQNGNGNAAYIDSLNEARKVLVHEAGSTLFAIAKDVKIQLEFNPNMVSQYRLVGYESRMLKREDFNNDKIDAGEVGAGHAVTAIYEITPAGGVAGVDDLRYGAKPENKVIVNQVFSGEYGFLKMRYKLPNESESKLITTPINSSVEVSSLNSANEDVRFATAVAAFGQILKGNQQLSGYSLDSVAALADGARGRDAYGYRSEFVQLVQKAKGLKTGYPVNPMPSPCTTDPASGMTYCE